jgi:hypothetical protein
VVDNLIERSKEAVEIFLVQKQFVSFVAEPIFTTGTLRDGDEIIFSLRFLNIEEVGPAFARPYPLGKYAFFRIAISVTAAEAATVATTITKPAAIAAAAEAATVATTITEPAAITAAIAAAAEAATVATTITKSAAIAAAAEAATVATTITKPAAITAAAEAATVA